ncbi:MAG: DUF6541 family protein [Terracoccus sp.]
MPAEAPTWAGMVPAFVVLSAVAFLPGWLVVRALGSRGLEALAVSPALSAGLIATAATAAQRVGVRWGWLPLLLSTVLAMAAAYVLSIGVSRLVERRTGRAAARLEHTRRLFGRPHPDAALAIAVGVVIAIVTIVPTLGRPDELVDSPDAVYHLDRIRPFLDTGNFSIANNSFYPNGFHAWIATGLQSGVADVLPGTNVATIVLAAVVWPVGCVALVRHALGTSRLVTYAAGFSSAALIAFPTLLLGLGVLWPNLMGTALTPGVLALMLQAARSKHVSQWLGFGASLPGLALVQPNAFVAIGVFALAWLGAARLRAGALRHASWLRVGRDLGLVAVALAVGLYVAPAISARLASTQSYVWTDRVSVADALVEVVGGRLLTGSVLWGPVMLLPIGIFWIVTRARAAIPVLAMWLAAVGLYIIAASSTASWTSLITGYWYNDKVRLASLAAVPGVVIVAAAAPAIRAALGPALRRLPPPGRKPLMAGVVALLMFPLLTIGWGYGVRHDTLVGFYRPADPTHVILSDQGRRDLAALAALIPPGEGVVGRPENGSPLMYALFGTDTLYRSIPIPITGDEIIIGTGFDQLSTRSDVCEALARHHVRWAIDSTHVYWLDRPERSSGLFDLANVEGVEPVKTVGAYTLFTITGCPQS